MTSPDTLRWAADVLRREAGGLVPTLERLLGALGPEVWSGPAADRVRGELEVERTALGDVAVDLQHLASEFEQQADHLEYQRRLEQERAREARRRAEEAAREHECSGGEATVGRSGTHYAW